MITSNSLFCARLLSDLYYDRGEKELQVLASRIGHRLLSVFQSGDNKREEEKKFIISIFNPMLDFLKLEANNPRPYMLLKECAGPLGSSEEFNWYFQCVLLVVRRGMNEQNGPPLEAYRCLAEFAKQGNKVQPFLLSKIDQLCFSSAIHKLSECREGALILWKAALGSFLSKDQGWDCCTLPLVLSVVKRLEAYDPEPRVSRRATKLLNFLLSLDIFDTWQISSYTESSSSLSSSVTCEHGSRNQIQTLSEEEKTGTKDLGDTNLSLISSFAPKDSNEEEIEYFLRGSIPNPLGSLSQQDFQDSCMSARNEISSKLQALFDSYPNDMMDAKQQHIIEDTIALLLRTTTKLKPENLSQLVHEAYLESLYPYLAQKAKHMINHLINRDAESEVEILNEQVFQEAETLETWFVRNVLPALVEIIKSTIACITR